MTVLIATIGGQPAPIVHAIQQTRPTHLAFLASRAGVGTNTGSEDEIEGILKAAGWSGPAPIIETTELPDELTAIWKACRLLAQRLPAATNVIANYTGGSKSMSAALVSYALRAGWALQVQSARRTDLVKIAASDRARQVAVGDIIAHDVRRQAAFLAQRHDHRGAAMLLEGLLAVHPLPRELQDELQSDIAVHHFEDAVESYDFETASGLLSARGGTLGKTHGATWSPRLRAFAQTLAWLSSPSEVRPKHLRDATSLVDFLVDTAHRSAERGRYDDAFSRLYRATELLAQVVLRFAFDLRTGDLDRTRIPEDFARKLAERKDGKLYSGLMESYALLTALAHPLGKHFDAKRDRLRSLLENRNDSWLAHGFRSITPSLWRDYGEPWIQWLSDARTAAQ